MKIDQITKGSASVSLTEADLILLNNALNEVINGLAVPEPVTRLGTSRQEAADLLHQISSLLSKIK